MYVRDDEEGGGNSEIEASEEIKEIAFMMNQRLLRY